MWSERIILLDGVLGWYKRVSACILAYYARPICMQKYWGTGRKKRIPGVVGKFLNFFPTKFRTEKRGSEIWERKKWKCKKSLSRLGKNSIFFPKKFQKSPWTYTNLIRIKSGLCILHRNREGDYIKFWKDDWWIFSKSTQWFFAFSFFFSPDFRPPFLSAEFCGEKIQKFLHKNLSQNFLENKESKNIIKIRHSLPLPLKWLQ